MSVVKHEGIRGLYKGFSASLLGLSESTLQFVLYERLKAESRSRNNGEDSFFGTFLSAAVAKLSAAIVTYPHEVFNNLFLFELLGITDEIKTKSKYRRCSKIQSIKILFLN